MSISFSFSKTSTKRKLTSTTALGGPADNKRLKDEDEIEFIQSIGVNGETKQNNKTDGKESNELVIPLIRNNRWYFPKDGGDKESEKLRNGTVKSKDHSNYKDSSNSTNGSGSDVGPKKEDLDAQAVREILNESRENGDKESVLNIPLLVQNRIPDGFETDDNLDVTLRPAEPSLDDYERIPVEHFGLAMLRGMGWKKGDGIGLRNKSSVELIEPNVRPSRLGLGATKPNTEDDDKKKNNNKRPASPPPMGLRNSKNKEKK